MSLVVLNIWESLTSLTLTRISSGRLNDVQSTQNCVNVLGSLTRLSNWAGFGVILCVDLLIITTIRVKTPILVLFGG